MTSPEKNTDKTPPPQEVPPSEQNQSPVQSENPPTAEEKPAEIQENKVIEGPKNLPQTYPKINDEEDPFDPADYGGTPFGGANKVTPKPNDFW
jgi:hypothetical protein